MEINLNNFVNAVAGQNTGAKATFNTVVDKTKAAGSSVVGAVKGVAPVTNNKFEKFVTQANEEMGNLDKRMWNVEFQVAMLAQATGTVLPSDDQMVEYRQQWEEEQAAQLKAEQEAKEAEAKASQPTTVTDNIISALANAGILESLKNALDGMMAPKTPVVEETPIEVTPVTVEPKVRTAPPVQQNQAATPKPEPKKDSKEWKQCVSCGTDISVVYKGDTCPHCKRTKQAQAAKNGEAPAPRLQFDN